MAGLDISYKSSFLSKDESLNYFNEVKNYKFENFIIKIKNNAIKSPRLVYAMGDDAAAIYQFSGFVPVKHNWTDSILQLKKKVQAYCNTDFNYVIINYYTDGKVKIGSHRDDELCLDPASPIATVSLGASRTINFSQHKSTCVKQVLEDASLLIMQPSVQQHWYHSIPAEPSVTDSRISISFRKVIQACAERPSSSKRPLEDSFDPPTKQKYTEEQLVDLSIKNFFASIPNRTIIKKDLTDNIYLTCTSFKNVLKIHIRRYNTDENFILYPTKQGITMCFQTWYDFFQKLFSFNLNYTSASFIANNELLVLNNNNNMLIQNFNVQNPLKYSIIELNYFQLMSLKENVYDFNNSIIEYLLTSHFAFFASCQCEVLPSLSSVEDELLLNKFISGIEEELSFILPKVYQCYGCIINHPSQLEHDCISKSNLEKYRIIGEESLLLINVESLVQHFQNVTLSQKFLDSISVSYIKDVLFEKKH